MPRSEIMGKFTYTGRSPGSNKKIEEYTREGMTLKY